jgi:hypothetical protein
MSEVKLNLVDAHTILSGTIHGAVADSTVAALSAEPETIKELEVALGRYIKPDETGEFASFRMSLEMDPTPCDAGVVIIDLAARVIASESTYSDPGPEGTVRYHDGKQLTDVPISYHLPDDWRFVKSVEAYKWTAERRRRERQAAPPLDARVVLYGWPMIEFVHDAAAQLRNKCRIPTGNAEQAHEAAAREIVQIHANWLTTPRADLRRRSPREVMLEKQDLIDLDMDSRCMQWSFQGEGPPCLPLDSFAYRYGGFGTHEWVVYYDLVRLLLWIAVAAKPALNSSSAGGKSQRLLDATTLDRIKTDWLENPSSAYDGRTPANIIDNERRRLPITMTAEQIMIDENCECCRMMAMEAEMGFGPTFWHLDTSNMEEEFAFSTCLTKQEWEAEIRKREEFHQKWRRERGERREAIARGELVDDEPWVGEAFDD